MKKFSVVASVQMNKLEKNYALKNITLIAIALIWPTSLLFAITVLGLNGWLRECPMWLKPIGIMVLTALLCANVVIVISILNNIRDNLRIRRNIRELPLLDRATTALLHLELPDLKDVTLRVYVWHEPLAFTIGSRSPVIVLSSWLVENFDRQELIATVAHELAHIQHQDMLLLFCLYSMCPNGWGLQPLQKQIQQLNLLIEKRADLTSIALTGQPMALASALVKVRRNLSVPQVATLSLTGNNNTSLLRQRVSLLLDDNRESTNSFNWRLCLLLVSFLIGTVLLITYANVESCMGWQCDL
jgi:Zn-dependent protease with chaperone function